MSWFTATAEQFGKTPSATPGYDDGSGRVAPLGGSGIWNPSAPNLDPNTGQWTTPATGYKPSGGSPEQMFMAIVQKYGPATPENLAKAEAELKAAGFTVRRNAEGVAGKVKYGDEIIDVVPGAMAGGGGAWQWLQGPGGPTGEGGKPLPGNQFYGQGPTGTLAGSMGGGANYAARLPALQQTPGYQFRMNQGLDAVQKSAAAKGTLLSGGTLKDLTEFAQGLASTEFDREFGRGFNLAQLGLRAGDLQGQYGTAYGNNLVDLTTGAGNAQAAGTATAGNAWGSALSNLGSLGLQAGAYNWLNQSPSSQPPTQPQNSLGVTGDYRVRWPG